MSIIRSAVTEATIRNVMLREGVTPPSPGFGAETVHDRRCSIKCLRGSPRQKDARAAGRCALRNERLAYRRGIRSLGSFHGNMLTSAFGASIAASMATVRMRRDVVRQDDTGVWRCARNRASP